MFYKKGHVVDQVDRLKFDGTMAKWLTHKQKQPAKQKHCIVLHCIYNFFESMNIMTRDSRTDYIEVDIQDLESTH